MRNVLLRASFRLLVVMAALAVDTSRAEDKPGCRLDLLATGTVGAVLDGRTLILTDGRETRLSSIEVPLPEPSDQRSAGAHGIVARDALAALANGKEVALRYPHPATDRYGRLIAHIFVERQGTEQSLAHDLVAEGHARLSLASGEKPCAGELIAAERRARAGKLGLWADPRYQSKRAENPAEILAERGRFTLVEGKVVSVRESGATIYLNFGRRWREAFTVTIAKRNERRFIAAGIAPKSLQDRRVQVRGWIEERGGPRIEAMRPEQIEIIDGN
jgi:endonuclease YncB( thermonuclease family)